MQFNLMKDKYTTDVSPYKTPVIMSKKSVSLSAEQTITFVFFLKHHYIFIISFEDHMLI